jgi:hypothetical protein
VEVLLMTTFDILFPPGVAAQEAQQEQPECFSDLLLDQVIAAMTTSEQAHGLKSLYFTSLGDKASITYRQDIMRDLEDEQLREQTTAFSSRIASLKRSFQTIVAPRSAISSGIGYLDKGHFLETIQRYCEAVQDYAAVLSAADLHSEGMLAARNYLQAYAQSSDFATLLADTEATRSTMATVRYCMLIKDSSIRVQKYEDEADYTDAIVSTFEKFKEGGVKSYLQDVPDEPFAIHVEEGVLSLLAGLFPEAFATLESCFTKHREFLDQTILDFATNVPFYTGYLNYIEDMRHVGLPFCYPAIATEDKAIMSKGGFDIALAAKLAARQERVVQNDFFLSGKEHALVISGPNQGGKTTFARSVGQLHFLASLGFCVPGTEARLFLVDNIYTHFEVEEKVESLNGKLQDELIRIHRILERATDRSLVIINEIFSSTSVSDAVFIGKRLLKRITDTDMLCVLVTFLDELSCLNEATVSMASTVVPETPSVRTFKIVRKPADGLAYAWAIAGKYHLTYNAVKERLAQ